MERKVVCTVKFMIWIYLRYKSESTVLSRCLDTTIRFPECWLNPEWMNSSVRCTHNLSSVQFRSDTALMKVKHVIEAAFFLYCLQRLWSRHSRIRYILPFSHYYRIMEWSGTMFNFDRREVSNFHVFKLRAQLELAFGGLQSRITDVKAPGSDPEKGYWQKNIPNQGWW